MHIEIIASTKGDNHFALAFDAPGGQGVLVDPVDSDAALARVQALGLSISWVVNTHWHPDHTQGNAHTLQATGARLAVPSAERSMIDGGQRLLVQGDKIEVGPHALEVLETPGHTQGHISLYWPGHLLCGDTVFVGGAGNCRFGGDPQTLYRTFTGPLARLPDETLLYPGHDYAVNNLEFCLSIEPANAAALQGLEEARRARAQGRYFQSTLGQERAWSPFFRCADPRLQRALEEGYPAAWAAFESTDRAERAFVTTRALRNTW